MQLDEEKGEKMDLLNMESKKFHYYVLDKKLFCAQCKSVGLHSILELPPRNIFAPKITTVCVCAKFLFPDSIKQSNVFDKIKIF